MSPSPAGPEPAILDVRLRSRRLRAIFLAAPWILSAAGLAVELAVKRTSDGELWGFDRLFSLSEEGNIPTLYQGCVLAVIGAMLWSIARAKRLRGEPWSKHWWWLGTGFLYIGLDEWASIHELSSQLVDLPGILYFGWIIPYGIIAAVCGGLFIPFLRSLPPRVRVLFVVSGAIYVAGALGMELPLGWWTARHGTENLGYALIDWVEESLEMLGAGLFAATVLELYRANVAAVRLEVTRLPRPADRPE